MSDEITLKIPSKPEYLLTARLAASSIGSRMGFNINDIEDIKTAIAESLLVIMHQQNANEIEINFINNPDSLEVTVSGVSGVAPNIDFGDEDSSLGRYLIDALSDNLEFDESDGIINKIHFTKKLQR